MKTSWMVPVVLALAVVGCGPATSSSDVGDTTTSRATPATSGASTSAATTATTSDGDPTSYLVEIANGAADLGQSLSAHEERINQQYANQSSEDEHLAYLEAYFGGTFSMYVEHGHWLEGITPPDGFVEAHARYVDAWFGLYEPMLETTETLETVSEWEAWLPSLFDEGSAAFAEPRLALSEACSDLESKAADGGYRVDLQCPTPPPEVVEVGVEVGGSWEASADTVPTGNVAVDLAITNTGDSAIQVVVIDIFEGDPLDLPVENGLVDIGLSGVTFDSDSTHAYFGVAYPDVFVGEDSQLRADFPELAPGETVHVTVWGSGPIVVFDYGPGEFEAGARVLIERGEERK